MISQQNLRINKSIMAVMMMMMMMMMIFKTSDPAKLETQPVSENQPVNPFSEIVALC
jgi:hypothetical protein